MSRDERCARQSSNAGATRVQSRPEFARLPRHVGLIPDGNRRWAKLLGLTAAEGYMPGVAQGLRMLDECMSLGIEEVSVYGFTQDNTKRPREQRLAFTEACEVFAKGALDRGARLLVLGDSSSEKFPASLRGIAGQRSQGDGLKINMLVNYGWEWDIRMALQAAAATGASQPLSLLASAEASRVDLIVRWGGCRRLSGFLPLQSVYADFFVLDEYWPDFEPSQFYAALEWYARQDRTLGG